MTTMNINNNSYVGRSITITNGKVIIDGKDVTPDGKDINISIIGNIDDIKIDYCQKIEVKGDVGYLATMSGDIEISGNIKGSISATSGDIECGDVSGNVNSTSGDIKCGTVGGSVSTMSGDIRNKK